jgi:hypothetical protein
VHAILAENARTRSANTRAQTPALLKGLIFRTHRRGDVADAHPQGQPPLARGMHATLEDLAKAKDVAPSYVSRILRLTLLAPEIVEAVLDGRQPAGLQLDDLLQGFPLGGRGSTSSSADGPVRPSRCASGWRPRSFAAPPVRPSSLSSAWNGGAPCDARCCR